MKNFRIARIALGAGLLSASWLSVVRVAQADFYQTWPNGGGWVSKSAQVAADAYISSFCMIGDGVKIGSGARVVDSTIQGNVVVGDAALVERSQLQGDVELGKQSQIIDSQLQGGVKVGKQAEIRGSSLGGELTLGTSIRIQDSRVTGSVRGTIGDRARLSSSVIEIQGSRQLELSVQAGVVVSGCRVTSKLGALSADAVLRIVGDVSGATVSVSSGAVTVLPSSK